MKLLLEEPNIFIVNNIVSKEDAIHTAIDNARKQMTFDIERVRKLIFDREAKRSSGVGKNVAVQHLLNTEIPFLSSFLYIYKDGIEWSAVDSKTVKIFFLMLAPPRCSETYYKQLISASRALAQESVRISILGMDTPAQISTVFSSVRS